jgi:isocitrate dehydrogenase
LNSNALTPILNIYLYESFYLVSLRNLILFHKQFFMPKIDIAVAKGDGIGPEIMDAVLNIFSSAGAQLEYHFVEMGKEVYEKGNSTGMTDEARQTIESLGILFKGPMETPKGKGVKSINVTARKVWNTYANKRVFRTLKGVDTVFSAQNIPIDITIVRENIEDTYGGIEHKLTHDVALCRRFITRPGTEQVHRYAFEMAARKNAKRITCGHKANIMKLTDGLFLEIFYEVAKDYPHLKVDDLIVDDLSMKLVTRPDQFDVVVLPNLQGDIISDLCAGLVGGLGFAPSANIGRNISIFEAVHGTAPDITGKNIANPTSLLLSGTMMLRHLGQNQAATKIEGALKLALMNGNRTADFGDKSTPALSTTDFAKAIIDQLSEVSVQEQDKPSLANPEKLSQNIILESPKSSESINGLDYFVESNQQPEVVAELFLATIDQSRFELIMMSNRGTQVWPTKSVFTECINQYRVRIELKEGLQTSQKEMLEQSLALSKKIKICSLEFLMCYGGQKAYSLAQGQ